MTVKVRVVIYEDCSEADEINIGYYEGQDYTVKIDTPDGTDAAIVRKAGTP